MALPPSIYIDVLDYKQRVELEYPLDIAICIVANACIIIDIIRPPESIYILYRKNLFKTLKINVSNCHNIYKL